MQRYLRFRARSLSLNISCRPPRCRRPGQLQNVDVLAVNSSADLLQPLSSSTQEHPPPFHVFMNKNPLRNNKSNLYEDSNWYHERDEVPDTWCPTREEVDAIAHEKFPGWTDEDFRKDMSKRVASPDFSDEDSDSNEVAQLSQPRSDNLNNVLQLSRAADGKSRGSARGRLISNVFADAKAAEEWRNDPQNKDKEEWCPTPEEHRAWLHDNGYDTGQYDYSGDRDDDDDDDTIHDTTHKTSHSTAHNPANKPFNDITGNIANNTTNNITIDAALNCAKRINEPPSQKLHTEAQSVNSKNSNIVKISTSDAATNSWPPVAKATRTRTHFMDGHQSLCVLNELRYYQSWDDCIGGSGLDFDTGNILPYESWAQFELRGRGMGMR